MECPTDAFTYLNTTLSSGSYDVCLFVVKLGEREGQGVDPGRSLKGHYGWWMVDGGYPFPDALH